jgi:hypothetical protein
MAPAIRPCGKAGKPDPAREVIKPRPADGRRAGPCYPLETDNNKTEPIAFER